MGWYKAPKHEVLSQAQMKRELKELGLDLDELPLITLRDAAIVDLINEGISVIPGDVVRISRSSKTAGEGYRYYRKVVV
jgi:DNA-directed RNA polymerase subunit H (RpoH/RPB5)